MTRDQKIIRSKVSWLGAVKICESFTRSPEARVIWPGCALPDFAV